MNIPKGTDQFKTALVYANYLHRHQTYKVNRIPYITHLLSVTALVLENKGSEDEAKRDRKQRYLQQLRQGSPSVRRVALADKLHNARTILLDYQQQGENLRSVFTSGKEGLLWFYHSLLKLYHLSDSSPMVAELRRVVEELEQLIEQPVNPH